MTGHRPTVVGLTILLALAACRGSQGPTEPAAGSATYLRASAFRGVTLGDKLTAAITALPKSGGVVDATDLAGDQRIDKTVHLGSATQPVELRLGAAHVVASVVPFVLHGNAKLLGDDRTTITQARGAGLAALIAGEAPRDCEIAHLSVDGNRSENTIAASGIDLEGAQGCRLHHLVVQNTVGRLHPGIRFSGPGNRDNTVEQNLVRDIGTLVDFADAIYVSGPGNKVLFNRIRGGTDFGVVAEACSGCVVEGNDIEGTPAGISVGSGIANTTAAANVIANNTITGGRTSTWGVITVYRTNGLAPVATTISGNVVRNVEEGHGILVNGAEMVSLSGNVLESIAPTRSHYGIFVRESRNVSITGGAVRKTGGFGVAIGGSANVQVNGVLITDAARGNPDASGIGLDVVGGASTSISLVNLHIFDTALDPVTKQMSFCIDFAQGGTTTGVLIGGNLYDDGVNALGCRNAAIRIGGATRVSTYDRN